MKLTNLRSRVGGMSIIELMVAMAVSLIGTIVIFQVYAVNEDVRRSSTAGSDQQTSGLQALMLIERELRHAGFGFNDLDLVGCKMTTFDTERTPNFPPAYPLSAVTITANAGNAPDVISVMYGGTNNTAIPRKITSMSATTDPLLVPAPPFGFLAGDMILVGQDAAGSDCTIREVTGVAGTQLQTITGTYWTSPLLRRDNVSLNKATRWNNPAGTPVAYGTGKVINLGYLDDDTGRPPRYNQITVLTPKTVPLDNNKLVMQNLWIQVPSFFPIAEQIVQLKAEYGMDDAKNNGTITTSPGKLNDGIVDRYTTEQPSQLVPTYVPSPNWRLIKTVRVAVVARSAQPLKPTVGTACDATPAFDPSLGSNTYPVRWAFGPDSPLGRPIDVSSSPDWQCYKYQVFEATVPLRNMLWSPPSQ